MNPIQVRQADCVKFALKAVPVVPSPAITSPALLVPIGSTIADNETAKVTDHNVTAFVISSISKTASFVTDKP